MAQVPGTLITRNYTDFRGVDFSNREVSLTRSPDSLNMWKDYKTNLGKCIETRPDIELLDTYDNTIFGQFFYKVGSTEMQIVHCGTKLYKVTNIGVVQKSDNINQFDILYSDFKTTVSNVTYEWRYDGVGAVDKILFYFTTVNSKKCMYIVRSRTRLDESTQLVEYLYGYFEYDGKYKFVSDTDDVPSSIKNNRNLTKYGEATIDWGHSNILTPRNTPTEAFPNILMGYTKTTLYSGMNPKKSYSFIYNNIFYIKDGINYLKYDGTTCQPVVGYVPTTSIGRKPLGGGTTYEDVNMLSPYRRNGFVGDGTNTIYYLDAKNIDNESPTVTVNGVNLTPLTEFTYDTTEGTITFATAPSEPYTDGQDNVFITYKKTVSGHADRIKKCTLLSVFDNRVFFSGNQDYPNTVWHSSLNDPSYCSDLDYYNEGLDLSPVKSMVAGNNALWVFKKPSQANTTVFYHNPVIDSDYGKIYPSTHSSISTGCISTGINFNDDIVFFSDRGMEAINGDVTTEQVLAHRSSLIDNKLLNETNYENMILEEWEGYLLIIIGNKVYLADSRAMFTNETHKEYEFFYWELPISVTCTQVKDGVLYLGTSTGIYTLTNNASDREINAYWTTPEDEFNYPQYQKTTNKRGCVIDMDGTSVSVSTKIDNNNFELINTYTTTKEYVVARIKKKKWKAIQLKFNSTKPFKLYSSTLESYVGGYVKR